MLVLVKKITTILQSIVRHPYNRQHPWDTLARVIKWYTMRALGRNYQQEFWGRKFMLYTKMADGRSSYISKMLAYFSWVDWEDFHFLQRYLRSQDLVFDVGGNIGLYSLWITKFIGEQGKIYTFEPDPENFASLSHNIRLNHIGNITLEPLAVSERVGKLYFTKGKDQQNHILMEQQNATASQAVIVEATSLDEYCAHYGVTHLDFLKIDIEGAEFFAIQGAASLLSKRAISVILLEINAHIDRFGIKPHQLLDLLSHHQYALYEYHPATNQLVISQETAFRSQKNYYAIRDIEYVRARLESIKKPGVAD